MAKPPHYLACITPVYPARSGTFDQKKESGGARYFRTDLHPGPRSQERPLFMDLSILNSLTLDWNFFTGLVIVIIVNVILSGDNAVVIAMAVRSLPRSQRKKGIVVGAGFAVLLQIVLTFFVARLLQTPYIRLVGGTVILWLAVKLFVDVTPDEDPTQGAGSIWQAAKTIVIANVTMSLDNMLGVGAASGGNTLLLILGIAPTVPVMIFASNLLSIVMDKYPIILYIGAAVLGKVGAEMILTDPVAARWIHPSDLGLYCVEGIFAIGVILVGKAWVRVTVRNSDPACQ